MKGQGRLLSARDRVLQEVLALKESQSVSPWEAGMAVEQELSRGIRDLHRSMAALGSQTAQQSIHLFL